MTCVLAVLAGSETVTAAPAAGYDAPAAVRARQPVPRPSPGVPPVPEPPTAPEPSGPGADRPEPDRTGSSGGGGDDRRVDRKPPAGSTGDPDEAPVPTPDPDDRTEGPADEPEASRLEDVRARLADLHDRAGSATDAYNAAQVRVEAQRRKVAALERRAKATRKKLATLTVRAGSLARAQYRTGGLPAVARLTLAEDPEAFLRDARLARQGQQAAKGLITRLTTTRKRLDRHTREARKEHAQLRATRARKAAAKRRIERDLAQARKLESRLAAEERARLRTLEQQAAYARQLRWLRSGVLAEIDGTASKKGHRAVAFATAQIGKDYEWGAEGPATYDCSGLTMRAWEAAGVSIPRTSQEQWRRLARVDMRDMRPGDLVVYKADASHVGMYLGDGVMVHAPRTGRPIVVEGVASLPILGVVRPDM